MPTSRNLHPIITEGACNKIKEIDPHTFIITSSSEIIGRGFRSV